MPTSWDLPFDLRAGLTPSRIVTRSELYFGFGADPTSDSSPVVSGSSEDIDTGSGGTNGAGMAPEIPTELKSFGPAPCPSTRPSAEGDQGCPPNH
jgi:hypothetical protein